MAEVVEEQETLDEVDKYIDLGYRAIRLQSGVPGLSSTYGVSGDKMFYEPADAGLPTENNWSTEAYLDHVPKLFAAAREQFGFETHLLHDVHHRLTPIEAARVGVDLEPFNLFWLEDPVPAENQAAFRTIRQHTTTPIAVGEVFNSIHDCAQLITEELIDYIRMAPAHGGGLTQLRKVAALAELHHVRTACHGATDLSPICMAAAVHFGASVSNFGIQEYMEQSPETLAVFRPEYEVREASVRPEELLGAAEVFLTGTTAGVLPVESIDGQPVGEGAPGPVSAALRDHFARIVAGEDEDFAHWLTYVDGGR